MVRLWGYMAPSAMAVFNERRYPLVADGEFFWGILAAGVDQPAGDYPVVIQLYQANGTLLGELQTQIGVVAMDYPVENIDLPPESTALLTPELAQEEANIRAIPLPCSQRRSSGQASSSTLSMPSSSARTGLGEAITGGR